MFKYVVTSVEYEWKKQLLTLEENYLHSCILYQENQ